MVKISALLKGFRTVLFAAVVFVINGVEALDWATIISPEWLPIFNTISSVVFMWLRSITDTAIGQK